MSLDDTRTTYYSYVQPKHQTLVDYVRHFQSLVDVLERYNASVEEDQAFLDKFGILKNEKEPDILKLNYTELKLKYNLKKSLVTRNRSLAVLFLKRVYKPSYGGLWTDLENQYTRRTDQYPKDLTTTYNMLLNYWKQDGGNNKQRNRWRGTMDGDNEEDVQT